MLLHSDASKDALLFYNDLRSLAAARDSSRCYGSECYVFLDMSDPVIIVELREKMINLPGLTVRSEANPSEDVAIEFSGLRPGKKLYDELLISDNISPPSTYDGVR